MKHIVLTSMPDSGLVNRWNTFIDHAPFATHYVTPGYFNDPYVPSARFAILAADDNGSIAAVVTGLREDKRIVCGLFSRPQMVFRAGVNKSDAFAAILAGVDDLSGESDLVELYAWEKAPALDLSVRESSDETSVVMLDLSLGADVILTGFSQTRRNELRKAVRHSLVDVKELETGSEIPELYEIHCDWNARKGNVPDGFDQFKTAISQRENRRVFIAKAEGKVIAGSFFRFCPGGVVEYAANFSKPKLQKLRPNDLIVWHAIQWACGAGFGYFSMGGSHLFLRRFGGEIRRTYRYRRDRSSFGLYDLRENARDFGLGVYKRLPETLRNGVRGILAR